MMFDTDTDVTESIRRELDSGIESPEIIAIKLGIDIDTVDEVVRTLKRDRIASMSNVDVMKSNLRVLQDLLDTAEWMYRAAPNIDNASAITSMISTSIQTIKEIESRKDPAVILNEILGKVIQPLFRDFIKYSTTEVSRARDELYQAVPKELHPRVDFAAKEIVKGIGRAGSEDYKRMVAVLASILECKPEDEKVKPLLRAVSDEAVQNEQDKEGTEDR